MNKSIYDVRFSHSLISIRIHMRKFQIIETCMLKLLGFWYKKLNIDYLIVKKLNIETIVYPLNVS